MRIVVEIGKLGLILPKGTMVKNPAFIDCNILCFPYDIQELNFVMHLVKIIYLP